MDRADSESSCSDTTSDDRSHPLLTAISHSFAHRSRMKVEFTQHQNHTSFKQYRRPIPSLTVPRLSFFYGIVIAMYYGDHTPPHFHARYGEFEAQIVISSGEVLHGHMPRRALGLVEEWVELHRGELEANWVRSQSEEPLVTIEPLP